MKFCVSHCWAAVEVTLEDIHLIWLFWKSEASDKPLNTFLHRRRTGIVPPSLTLGLGLFTASMYSRNDGICFYMALARKSLIEQEVEIACSFKPTLMILAGPISHHPFPLKAFTLLCKNPEQNSYQHIMWNTSSAWTSDLSPPLIMSDWGLKPKKRKKESPE